MTPCLCFGDLTQNPLSITILKMLKSHNFCTKSLDRGLLRNGPSNRMDAVKCVSICAAILFISSNDLARDAAPPAVTAPD